MKTLELGGFAAMRCEDKDGIQIVSVSGEVDLYSAHRLRELLWHAKGQTNGDPPRVVVDLSGVEFIDTAGVEVLLEEWNASRQCHLRICLVAQQGRIRRLLEVTGLSELFDLYAELEAAVRSCQESLLILGRNPIQP
jgi:anti-sigma B factor antagonist